jgi:hypothetical protein
MALRPCLRLAAAHGRVTQQRALRDWVAARSSLQRVRIRPIARDPWLYT